MDLLEQTQTLPIDIEFDVAFADTLARFESYNKHLYRPNSYLHKWWARRCGSTFRTILKHLVTDLARQDYYAPGGLEGKIVLDPMMGGGTTLHEAIRLGANVIGVDIDPIPVLQARATLSEVSLWQLRQDFRCFFGSLAAALAPFYQTECPTCGTAVPMRYLLYGHLRQYQERQAIFVDSLGLRHNVDGSVIRLCPETHHIYHDDQLISRSPTPSPLPIYEQTTRFLNGHRQAYQEDRALPFYQRYVPLVVVGSCLQHGLFFTTPGQATLDALAEAEARRPHLSFDPADFQLAPGAKSASLQSRGIKSYLDLFTSRQLLFLALAIEKLADFDPLVRLNLALLVSTSLEFNSLLCRYKGGARSRPGAIRHVFAHHAYSFPQTAVENNPLYAAKSSGSLQNLFYSRLVRGRSWARRPTERRVHQAKVAKVVISEECDQGTECATLAELQTARRGFLLHQGSAVVLALPDHSVDFIVTDPPYFDSVQYSDLAGYFHVWLRQMLPDGVNGRVPLAETAVGPRSNVAGQYEAVLTGIFAECARVLRANGRFIFTFHHWNPKAWSALTLALQRAGFRLINRYVVHAENLSSVHIAGQKALTHDVILVLGTAATADHWVLPEAVNRADSQQFCHDCGTILGWMLVNTPPANQVAALWARLLRKTDRP